MRAQLQAHKPNLYYSGIKAGIFLVILLFYFAPAPLFSQKNNYLQDVVINPPNAASLGKYGEIPVSYHTGIPDVSVPIYTLKEGPLHLPVSLSYHSQGVKVSETASWVGIHAERGRGDYAVREGRAR